MLLASDAFLDGTSKSMYARGRKPLMDRVETTRERGATMSWYARLWLGVLGSIVASGTVTAYTGQPASTVGLCQYVRSNGKYLITTVCTAWEQAKQAEYGFTYVSALGYAFYGGQAQPVGTVELCQYDHKTAGIVDGHLTTTVCSGSIGNGYEYVWKLGWVFSGAGAKPPGTVEFCEYSHATLGALTTTACSGTSRSDLEANGWVYQWKLAYVFSPAAAAPWSSPFALTNGTIAASVYPSSQRDLALYTQVFQAYPSEIPPSVITADDNVTRIYLLPTAWTWKCFSTLNYLQRPIVSQSSVGPVPRFSYCPLATWPDALSRIETTGAWTWGNADASPDPRDWRRGYNAVFGVHVVNDNGARNVIGFTHGQNDNVKLCSDPPACQHVSYWSQNTIKAAKTPSASDCKYCGGQPCGCPECAPTNCNGNANCSGNWPGYQEIGWCQFGSFAAKVEQPYEYYATPMSYPSLLTPLGVSPLGDAGPVLWPGTKYSDPGGPGPYHITSFIGGGYSYLYYHSGLPSCTKMARAAVTGSDVGAFYVLQGTTFPNPSLPTGFTTANAHAFLGQVGTESTCMFSDEYAPATWAHGFFNIAQVRANGVLTPYYLAVEDRSKVDGSGAEVVLRISNSPSNWAASTKYPIETLGKLCFAGTQLYKACNGDGDCPSGGANSCRGGWGTSHFTYASLVDKNGKSNDVIDAEEFYVVGNNPSGNHFSGETHRMTARRYCIQIAGTGVVCSPT
jgi:hypothetical protein